MKPETEHLIKKLSHKIDSASEQEIKEDLKKLLTVIAEFVLDRQPNLVKKNLSESDYIGMALKLVGSLTGDLINPFSRKKLIEHFSTLKDVILKYANHE